MARFGFRVKQLILVFGDYAVFQGALLLTLLLRYGALTRLDWSVHIVPFSILALGWVMSFYVVGLYDLALTGDSLKFFRTFLEGMIVNLALALAFFYLIPIFGIAPRTNLILYFALALLLGYAWRMIFNRTIAPAIFRNRVLYVGNAEDASQIEGHLRNSALGFELVAVIETVPGSSIQPNAIEQMVRDRGIQTIVLGHTPDSVPGLRDALYHTLFTAVTLIDRASLEEMMTGRVPLEHVSQTWFLEHLRESDLAWYEAFKRVTDILLAVPIGLLTLVLYPFIAVGIKVSSKGPVLYSQIRTGKYGKPFRIWKFRTMRQDAEVGGAQFAQKDDPRVTNIGKFLRKTRLDELPQIWNVLRGDMSFIGPRPERPQFVEELTSQMPFYALRHLTRPGLTGWAQVRFPYAGTIEDNLKKLQYDLYYIKHRTLLLDIAIFLKTIGIVVRRQGT
jgi:exopolysaccharide biosynthesis polyprenyl glycosylphosphotransferase